MEQTATKQLYLKLQQIDFYYQQGNLTITEFIEAKKEAFLQAEATFKQQIIKAHMNVNDDRDYRFQDVILKEFAEQYYNEKYGKQ